MTSAGIFPQPVRLENLLDCGEPAEWGPLSREFLAPIEARTGGVERRIETQVVNRQRETVESNVRKEEPHHRCDLLGGIQVFVAHDRSIRQTRPQAVGNGGGAPPPQRPQDSAFARYRRFEVTRGRKQPRAPRNHAGPLGQVLEDRDGDTGCGSKLSQESSSPSGGAASHIEPLSI